MHVNWYYFHALYLFLLRTWFLFLPRFIIPVTFHWTDFCVCCVLTCGVSVKASDRLNSEILRYVHTIIFVDRQLDDICHPAE